MALCIGIMMFTIRHVQCIFKNTATAGAGATNDNTKRVIVGMRALFSIDGATLLLSLKCTPSCNPRVTLR